MKYGQHVSKDVYNNHLGSKDFTLMQRNDDPKMYLDHLELQFKSLHLPPKRWEEMFLLMLNDQTKINDVQANMQGLSWADLKTKFVDKFTSPGTEL